MFGMDAIAVAVAAAAIQEGRDKPDAPLDPYAEAVAAACAVTAHMVAMQTAPLLYMGLNPNLFVSKEPEPPPTLWQRVRRWLIG